MFHLYAVLDANLTAATVVLCVTIPVSWMALFLGVAGLNMLASVVLCDHVTRVTKRVRASTPDTADFDGLLRDVAAAHDLISAVAAALEKPILCLVATVSAFGVGAIFSGLENRPKDEEHLWNRLFLPKVSIFAGAVFVFVAIILLQWAAQVTSKCDELGDAINELTTKGLGMPTREQKHNIEHLHGFLSNLNRRKGMGFMILRKRITHSFVISTTARVVSVMGFLFPIMLSLLRVHHEEGDELELINATCSRP